MKVVRARVSVFGLTAGSVGEVTDEQWEMGRKSGYLEAADTLDARLGRRQSDPDRNAVLGVADQPEDPERIVTIPVGDVDS